VPTAGGAAFGDQSSKKGWKMDLPLGDVLKLFKKCLGEGDIVD
jgi:hypothetical protein